MLWKKAEYPKRIHKFNSSEKCNAFDSAKIRKNLDERLAKLDSTVNQFLNTEKKIHKKIKALKKHNKMMFKIANNTSTQWDINKTKKVNISSYDSSIRDVSSVFSDSGSSTSYISFLSDQEGGNTLRR